MVISPPVLAASMKPGLASSAALPPLTCLMTPSPTDLLQVSGASPQSLGFNSISNSAFSPHPGVSMSEDSSRRLIPLAKDAPLACMQRGCIKGCILSCTSTAYHAKMLHASCHLLTCLLSSKSNNNNSIAADSCLRPCAFSLWHRCMRQQVLASSATGYDLLTQEDSF